MNTDTAMAAKASWWVSIRRPGLVAMFCLFAGARSVSADERSDQALLDQLLKEPTTSPAYLRQVNGGPSDIRDRVPAPDGPIEDVANFWRYTDRKLPPDPKTVSRLLEWCEKHPDDAPDLLRWCPEDRPEIHDELKGILGRLPARPPNAEFDRYNTASAIHEWLMTHSRHYRGDLVTAARKAIANKHDYTIDKYLGSLVRMDRPAAKKLLQELLVSKSAYAQTVALSWFYERQLEGDRPGSLETRRAELQAIVSNAQALPEARDYALQCLMRNPWQGQEEWFLGLFRDMSLATVVGKSPYNPGARPLCIVVKNDPDRWTPKVAALIGSQDRTTHLNAARCLSQFVDFAARADAVRPLLPWLQDPQWADTDDQFLRLRIVRSIASLKIQEAVPGLGALFQSGDDDMRNAAVDALARCNPREAVEIFRNAIPRETNADTREKMIVALHRLNAFSLDEEVQAIRAHITKTPVRQEEERVPGLPGLLEPPEPPGAAIPDDTKIEEVMGSALVGYSVNNDALVKELTRPPDGELAPETARRLQMAFVGWSGNAAMRQIRMHLQAGDLDLPWTKAVLYRRKVLAREVAAIPNLHGLRRGIQAAITGDAKEMESLLSGDDRLAKQALLASVRVADISIPLATVEPALDSADAQTARAAELYLLSKDTPMARAAVLRHHPGAARILGLREKLDPARIDEDRFSGAENRLRALVQAEEGPREIVALLSTEHAESDEVCVLLAYEDRIVLRALDGRGRLCGRTVAPSEFARFRSWLDDNDVDDLGEYNPQIFGGVLKQYVRLSRDGGRRIFMNNPPTSGGDDRFYESDAVGQDRPDDSIYERLVGQFERLTRAPMAPIYGSASAMPGFRVLHAREQGETLEFADNKGRTPIIRVETDRYDVRKSTYRTLTKNGLSSAEIERPSSSEFGYRIAELGGDTFHISNEIVIPGSGALAGQSIWRGLKLKGGKDAAPNGTTALWISKWKAAPQLLARGNYGRMVVTADGEWVVASKSEAGQEQPRKIVRIRVKDGQESPVDLPAAERFVPLAWIAAHEKVLLCRSQHTEQSENAETAPDEYYLYDPVSSSTEQVYGEFDPFHHAIKNTLQPTKRSHETWAAIPDSKDGVPYTIVGRYDTQAFKLTSVATFTELSFTSREILVDEAARTITILVDGNILRVDLP